MAYSRQIPFNTKLGQSLLLDIVNQLFWQIL